MNRRKFIELSAGGIACSPWFGQLAAAAENEEAFNEMGVAAIRALFESDNEQALQLAEDVFQKCVLERILPPTPPLKQNWVYPGGPHYKGQWIWDTMFVVDLLSILPNKAKVIRDIFQNYWDFQDHWNKKMPAYARDMITVAIKTAPQAERQFSQIPILAWGLERVYSRNGDKALLSQCIGRIERFHDWYWRERDVTNVGLCAVGSYSGEIQHARWETFDYECNMDDLRLTVHPTRKGPNEGKWYGVPTDAMAKRMAETLASDAWQTPLPIPTVDRTDPRWKSNGFWRGDVWPSANYQVASGLADYGFKSLAAEITDKTVSNAIKNGINEHYDSVSGKGIGVEDYCMSSTLLTMMLDGLTDDYQIGLHQEGQNPLPDDE